MARPGVRHDHILIVAVVVDDALHARPGVLDVVEVPPEVAVLDDRGEVGLHAGVDLVDGPAAGVDHGPSGLVEVEAELGVSPVHVPRMGVAPVEFHVVHVPGGEGLRVQLQIPEDARIARAGVVAEVFVNPEFQSFGMYLN